MSSIIQLECQCNNYPWGKKGSSSLAAKFAASTPGGHFKLDEDKEYAEMWMGSYPTTPSLLLSTGEDLQKHIDANKEKLVGKAILDKFGSNLPFLPKILSIAKALPLQIHPDKELAAKLHKKDPEKFSDDNHKPEIAVALGKFEVFVGWKPVAEIQTLFQEIPILGQFLPSNAESTNFDHDTLKQIVSCILNSPESQIKEVHQELMQIPKEKYESKLKAYSYIPSLLPRLAEQYSEKDPGNLVALTCMNFLVLQRGDAIYVPADGIHAYLSGDIVECMARSDNVLNTGFCPAADRDSIELFTAALTFSPKSAEEAILKPKKSEKGKNGKTKVLAPPLNEFKMLVVELSKASETETISALGGPAILVVTGGNGVLKGDGKEIDVKEGYVFLVGVDTELGIEAGKEGLEMHIAYCEA